MLLLLRAQDAHMTHKRSVAAQPFGCHTYLVSLSVSEELDHAVGCVDGARAAVGHEAELAHLLVTKQGCFLSCFVIKPFPLHKKNRLFLKKKTVKP
jgi:hypothetical protein